MTERRINIRVSPGEFKLLDDKRHAEHTTWQDIGRALFLRWLGAPPLHEEVRPVPKHYLTYLDKLAAILRSDDEAVIDAVTQNVDVFFDRLRPSDTSAKSTSPRRA